MSILEAKNIKKIYNGDKEYASVMALSSISLEINEGEFVSIMGASGSGKTTLLNILSGLDSPTSGSVLIQNQNINEMKKDDLAKFRRSNIGFVYQDFQLLESMTVKENIMLPMILDRKSIKSMNIKADEYLKLLSITDITHKYPNQLSGGQQQKIAIARALINNTVIVFADEPTGNLDSHSSKLVMKTFANMNDIKKTTILMVTHDPISASFSNRVIFIKDGKIKSQIYKKASNKDFFKRIVDYLAVIEGDLSDI